MKKFINRIYNSQKAQLLFSFVLAFICFAFAYLTHGVYWETSDDPGIINFISGKYTGTPSFSFPFLNAFLGHFFATLYSITPTVPWYSIFHMIIKFVSLVVIFRLTFLVLNRKNLPWFIPTISCVFLFLTVFLYPTLYMSFTTTSAISGCTAIALLFIADMNSESKLRYVQYLLSGFFLIIAFMIRYQCGLVSTCFWALSLAFIAVKAFQKDKKIGFKKIIKSGLAIILVFIIGFAQNSLSYTLKANYEKEDYLEYDSYRSKFVDFTTVSWDTDKEFYEELGWDEDFYKLAKSWFFMDARFNIENLKAINQETLSSGYGKLTIKEAIYSFCKLILSDTMIALPVTLIVAILFAIIFIEFLLSKDKKKNIIYLLFALFAIGGMGIMCLYQCIQGRFLLRVYQTIAFPTIITLLAIAINFADKKLITKCKRWSKVAFALFSVLIIFSAVVATYGVYAKDAASKENSKQELVEYASQNPDNLYVYSPLLSSSYEAFSIYNPDTAGPRNTISWGGCSMYSRSYYELLKLHNYDEFYSNNFYDENVYLVSPVKNEDILKRYLEHNYGPTEMVEIYRTNSFVVYDINHITE